jgi:hypothetical protein
MAKDTTAEFTVRVALLLKEYEGKLTFEQFTTLFLAYASTEAIWNKTDEAAFLDEARDCYAIARKNHGRTDLPAAPAEFTQRDDGLGSYGIGAKSGKKPNLN